MLELTLEPRAITADVRKELEYVLGHSEEEKERVAAIAERAGTSTRTVYRVLSEDNDTISLDLADRLLVAIGAHIRYVRLVHDDGTIELHGETVET